MSIYRRGKSWYINIRLGGVRINRKAGNTKTEAKTVEETLKTKYRLKQLHLSEISNEDIPFHYLADLYFKHIEDVNAFRTYQVEKNFYKNHIKPNFEPYMAYDINDALLLDFQARMKAKSLANRTTNILVGIVRKILKHGASRHIIRTPDVQFPKLKESRRLHAFFSDKEFNALLPRINDDMTRARVIVTRHTGMRPAEAAYLAWNDVHFGQKYIKIQGKEIKPGKIWKAKDSEERTIPLNQAALSVLKALHRKRKSQWVFSRNDSPVIDIDKALITAAKNAGISRKVGPNMLRHTFAVLQLQRGANIEAIRKIMGHSDIRTTMRYLDCIDEEKKKAVK